MDMTSRVVFPLSLLLLLSVALVAGAISFGENFDGAAAGQAPAGWEDGGDVKATSIVVDKSAIAPDTPPNCLQMTDDSPGGAAQVSRWFGDAKKGTVRFTAHNPAASPGDLYCTLRKGGTIVLDFQLSAGGNVKYRDASGSLKETGTKYALDAWHVVEIGWDLGAGNFSVVCDGAKIGEYPLIKTVAPDTLLFKLGSSNKVGMVAFVDSIEVKTE